MGTGGGSQWIRKAHWSIKIVGLTFRYPLEGIKESKSTFIQDIQAAVKILKYTPRFQSAVTIRGLLLGVSICLCAYTVRLNSVTLTLKWLSLWLPEKSKGLFYPKLPDFRKTMTVQKIAGFRLFNLQVRTTCRWGRVWSTAGMMLTEKNRIYQ